MSQCSAILDGIPTQFNNFKEMDKFVAEKKRLGYVYE